MIEYIFCINTGRSGSMYLTRLFGAIEGCASFHEPQPILNGLFMRKILKNRIDKNYLQAKMEEKVKAIHAGKGDNKLYVETSHVFIKSFGWYLPDYIPKEKIGVVLLEREKKEIVNSLYRINCRPTNTLGQTWLITPNNSNPITKIPVSFPRVKYFYIRMLKKLKFDFDFIKTYEVSLLNWYVNECIAQGKLFQSEFPDIRYYKTSIYKLNEPDEFQAMLDFFEIDLKKKVGFNNLVGIRQNTKQYYKPVSIG